MRCFAPTKARKRCGNTGNFLFFCGIHRWWLAGFLLTVIAAGIGAISDLGGTEQVYTSIITWLEDRSPSNNALRIDVKSERRNVAEWENDPDPTKGRPDVVTIFVGNRPIRTLELFHTIKDQRFKDYPATAPLADFNIPTVTGGQIVSLTADRRRQAVLSMTNQIYSLHPDRLVSVLVYGRKGELLAKTPYPDDVPGLPITQLSPYSAYKSTGSMFDAIANTYEPITYANDFRLCDHDGNPAVAFSWVIDNAAYAAEQHLHSVETYVLREGGFEKISGPTLFITESWGMPGEGAQPVDTEAAAAFLKAKNIPPMRIMGEEWEKALKSEKRGKKRRSAASPPPQPNH